MDTSKLRKGIQAGVAAAKAFRRASSALAAQPAQEQPVHAAATERPAEKTVEVLPPTIIRTSEKDWLPRLTRAYREHTDVELIDDAQVGVDPATQSLLQMGLAGRLSPREWTAVAVSAGMTIFGAGLVVAAILDPDPTSKLGLLVASGALLALTGGLQTIHLLTRLRPPSITISPKGVHIDWH